MTAETNYSKTSAYHPVDLILTTVSDIAIILGISQKISIINYANRISLFPTDRQNYTGK